MKTTIYAVEFVVADEENTLKTTRHWQNIYSDKNKAIQTAKSCIEYDKVNYFQITRVKEINVSKYGSTTKLIAEFYNKNF